MSLIDWVMAAASLVGFCVALSMLVGSWWIGRRQDEQDRQYRKRRRKSGFY